MIENEAPLLPPDDLELDQLDLYLRHAAAQDSLLLDGVHGLLTALAVGPEPALPEEWLPQVLSQPFSDEGEGSRILDLLARLNDSIPDEVASEDYAPILGALEEAENDKLLTAAGWCEGFSRGIDLRAPIWEGRLSEDPELMEMLGPIMALGLEDGVFLSEDEFEHLSNTDYHTCVDQIPLAVAALRHYWRVHPPSQLERSAIAGVAAPLDRGTHRVH